MGFRDLMDTAVYQPGDEFQDFVSRFWNNLSFSKIEPDSTGSRWKNIDADIITAEIRETVPDYYYDPNDLYNVTSAQQKAAFKAYMTYQYQSKRDSDYAVMTKDRQEQNFLRVCDLFQNEYPGLADQLKKTKELAEKDRESEEFIESYRELMRMGLKLYQQKLPEMPGILKDFMNHKMRDKHIAEFPNVALFAQSCADIKGIISTYYEGDEPGKEKMLADASRIESYNTTYERYFVMLASPVSTKINYEFLTKLDTATLNALNASIEEKENIRKQNEGNTASQGDGQYLFDQVTSSVTGRDTEEQPPILEALQSTKPAKCWTVLPDGRVVSVNEDAFTQELRKGTVLYVMNEEKPELGAVPAHLTDQISHNVVVGDAIESHTPKKPAKPESPGNWEIFKDWFRRTFGMEKSRSDVGRKYHAESLLYQKQKEMYKASLAAKQAVVGVDLMEKADAIAQAKFNMTAAELKQKNERDKAAEMQKREKDRSQNAAKAKYQDARAKSDERINALESGGKITKDTATMFRAIAGKLQAQRERCASGYFGGNSDPTDAPKRMFACHLVGNALEKNIAAIEAGSTDGLTDEIKEMISYDGSKLTKATVESRVQTFITNTVNNDDTLSDFMKEKLGNGTNEIADMINMNQARTQTMVNAVYASMKEDAAKDIAPGYVKLITSARAVEEKKNEELLLQGNSLYH